jgi:hypothetical protein
MTERSEGKGTKLHFPELPHYLTVEMVYDKENDDVRVVVHSTIHVNKTIMHPMQWTKGFIDKRPKEFAGDVLGWIVKVYGLKPAPFRYE